MVSNVVWRSGGMHTLWDEIREVLECSELEGRFSLIGSVYVVCVQCCVVVWLISSLRLVDLV